MTGYLDLDNFVLVFRDNTGPTSQRQFTPAERSLLQHIQGQGHISAGVLSISLDIGLSYRYTHALITRLKTRGLILVGRGERRRLTVTNISREGLC